MKARTAGGAIPLGIALATFVAFSPALWNGFVDWDDNVNILTNPHYRGFGWAHLSWMFTSTVLGHWIPVTWLTFALDYVVWGMNPLGYHLTNVLLHAVNAALFFVLARRLLARAWEAWPPPAANAGAVAAALFFGLHPLRAESVAWVTERRDMLSGFFALLTVLAYLRVADAPSGASANTPDGGVFRRRRRYLALSIVCFALGLMSKASVMMLPIVLVILDVYPLRRQAGSRGTWLEKIPYVVLAVAGGAVAFWAQLRTGLLSSVESHAIIARLAMGAYSVVFYVSKTIVPSGLMPEYQLPSIIRVSEPRFVVSVVIVIAVTVALVALRRRAPALLAVWLAYGVLLAPVSGVVHTGYHLVADRYAYVACAPLALLIGAGVATAIVAISRGLVTPGLGRVVVVTLVAWGLGLGAMSWNQVQIWKDTETLWRYAVDVDPDCALCHSQLGAELGNRGLIEPALEEFARGVALRPDDAGIRGNFGLALVKLNRPDEAIEQFRRALARRPGDVSLRNRLAAALIRQRRFDDAAAELRNVLRADPDHAEALANLAIATHGLGRSEEARGYLRRAIALEPDVAARFDPAFVAALLRPAPGRTPAAR